MAVRVRQHPEATDRLPQRAGSHTHPGEIVGGEVDRDQSPRFLQQKRSWRPSRVLATTSILATFTKTRIDSLATEQSVDSLSSGAGREPVTDAGSKQRSVHGEVGDTWPLPKEDIEGKVVVSTNVALDGGMEAPDR